MEINRDNIVFYLAPVVVVLAIIVAVWGFRSSPVSSASIVFWGFEDAEFYRDLIKDFRAAYPNVSVEYVQKSEATYEKELLNAMASGQGPDVFPVHHTWLPQYEDKIYPLPASLMSLKTYYDTFVDVAAQDFILEGNIYAAPWYIDTLALYWNKDFFNTAAIAQPPSNWDEFVEDAQKITIKDENSNISRAGCAFGTSTNVENSADILALLMMQTGAKMITDNKKATFNQEIMLSGEPYKPGVSALEFYTNFANPQYKAYTWNSRMGNSLESFIQGKAAMIFDYSGAVKKIIEQAPYLNFGIAPMPQVKKTDVAITYADYWGESVWSGTKSPEAAWAFVLWMAGQEGQKKYAEKAEKPVSRRDLVSWQESDQNLGVFARQSLSARSWYQVDEKAIKEIFRQMIDSIVFAHSTTEDAVSRAANEISALMEENE